MESNHSDKAQILRGPAPNLFFNYSLLLLAVLFVLKYLWSVQSVSYHSSPIFVISAHRPQTSALKAHYGSRASYADRCQ
jgi:hypothetical protein